MHIALAILQIVLALHTLMGAYWKLSNPAKSIPSLAKIPSTIWLGMSTVEFLAGAALIAATAYAPLAHWAPIATIVIGVEMLFLCVVHLVSGNKKYNPMLYWLIVAAICAAMVYTQHTF